MDIHRYEASLTPKKLERLHRLLRTPRTVDQLVIMAPPWGKGRRKGKRPSPDTLFDVRARLETQSTVDELSATAAFINNTNQALKEMVKGTNAEGVLDQVMMLLGQEVIYFTLKRLNPAARTAATRLLLKRADQRRVDRRLDLAEETLEKPGNEQAKSPFSATEKEAAVKQILGIN